MSEDPRCGWNSKFPHFRSTPPKFIRESLSAYVKDAGPDQIRAWDTSIPPLQNEVGEILQTDTAAPDYSTILEYTLPMESRRTDVIFLVRFGVPNDFQSTKRVRYGPWYSDPETAPGGFSCRHLRDAVTEFGAQGLELDAVLLAWGTDFMREKGRWTNRKARGYQRSYQIKDPFKLRMNSYRVLLTRGRDGTVVFIPPLPELEETREYLIESGFRPLD